MYIKNLTLKNYRNYKFQSVNFSRGINILSGDNAQGKTNCAEAVFYLCTGYSPRAARDKQVIRYGESSASVTGKAVSQYGGVEVGIDFSVSANKAIKINGVPIKKIGELMGNINSVFFNPGELKLIQDSPEDRRRFMDISLSQMSKTYFYSLSKYRKILEQRNVLLKNPDKEVIYATLPLWDEQLAVYCETIVKERLGFIKKLLPHAVAAHNFLSDGKENLTLSLESFFKDESDIKSSFLIALSERIEKDVALGYTGIGPHRDDIKIKINGEDVRVYGSQGQQRSCALSLKLAELEVFKERFGEYPVLILDDALSELDKTRRERLLKRTENVQTIITCTDVPAEFSPSADIKIFKVESGVISESAAVTEFLTK